MTMLHRTVRMASVGTTSASSQIGLDNGGDFVADLRSSLTTCGADPTSFVAVLARHGETEETVERLAEDILTHGRQVLLAKGIKISVDGKGAWRENVFVQRFRKSVKYEEVYLRAYETMSHAGYRLTETSRFSKRG